VAQTVGHTQVRQLVLGDVDRRPSDEEMERMKGLVREGMEAGAIGLSSALIYPPAVYAPTQELAELAKVAGEYGGRYYTHMRNEGDRLLEAIDEALDIGRTAGTPVHIFHLKAAGRQNWSKMSAALEAIRQAREAGESVAADIYPYVNNGLGIGALIHPRHFGRGEGVLKERLRDDAQLRQEIQQEMETSEGWENWFRHVGFDWNRVIVGRSNSSDYRQWNGQSIAAIATATEKNAWEVFFDLVQSDAFVLPETMLEANLMRAMQQPFISFCTDVGPAGGSGIASHPRAAGAFPRLFARYVRQLGAMSLEQAVSQATAVAANEIMAFDRGRLSVGLAADVIVFDFDAFTDLASFAEPGALAVGMQWVVVNGQVVYRQGEYTGARPGRVLRGPGYQAQQAPQHISRGATPKGFEVYDRMMHDLLRDYRLPGASIAVTDGGRVVFAKGYGYADIAAKEAVEVDSLFRIASVSKPITAVAILQLVEQGKLSLDDKLWEVLDWNADIEAAEGFDLRQRDITIRHLLQHRGGWDRKESFDAMFQSVRFAQELAIDPPADPLVVMKAMLRQPLDFAPGERYAYSNYGYCLLGRIIEQLSGQDYESYVQQHVLAPIDVSAMRLGKTRLGERASKEVRYYHSQRGDSVFADSLGREVPSAYGAWYLEAMDAHGGWLATASDIAKFAAAFDDREGCAILSRDSIDGMQARPDGLAGFDEDGKPKDVYYSLGWNNRDLGDGRFNHWHGGSLPGTTTIVIRRHDGKNFVALLNTRQSYDDQPLSGVVDRLLHEMANQVPEWPVSP
jgi:N-acyl-D-amino-acid deacylase